MLARQAHGARECRDQAMIDTKIGQYRVVKLLGEGGMGRVLLAEHAVMKTRHAIKMLHSELSNNAVVVQRFLNEARAASAIGHRNVVEITHVDQVEGGGPWYLVMKYLEGQTLSKFLEARSAPLEQPLIVHILGEALNGLQAAHDRRIVHRDLKPDNLYLTTAKDDPYRTLILDFGIAQLGHDPGLVTRTGTVIGTPQYMAPEQHRGAAIDHRADIWAMGAVAYQMATGHLPYQDTAERPGSLTPAETFYRMMTRAVADPRYYNPILTERFATTLIRALSLDPANRPRTARELAVGLAEATPASGSVPSGIDLLRIHADELLYNRQTPSAAAAATTMPAATAPHRPLPGAGHRAELVAAALHDAPTLGLGPTVLSPVLPPPALPPAALPYAPPEAIPRSAVGLPPAAQMILVPDVSTLGATASQSSASSKPRRARRWLAVGLGAAAPLLVVALVATTQRPSATNASLHPAPDAPASITQDKPSQDDARVTASKVDSDHAPAATTPRPPATSADAPARSPRPDVHASSATLARPAATSASPPRSPPSPSAAPQTAALPPVPGSPPPPSRTAQADVSSPASGRPSPLARPTQPDAVPVLPSTSQPPARAVDAADREPATPPRAMKPVLGRLEVFILPWAEVWADGKPLGQTPVHAELPPGPHRIRLKNDATDKTISVTIAASRTIVIDETWSLP